MKAAVAQYDNTKTYSLPEAASLVKKITSTKFDASVDLAVRLGVDPKNPTKWFVELYHFLTELVKTFAF